LLDAEVRHEMKREGIVPNVWVFPDRMLIYVNMVGDHQLSYSERGPEANSNRESGDNKTTFRGTPVFESQSFDVDFTGQPIDLMVRERQCGEFFVLKPEHDDKNPLYVYSAETDNWAPLVYGNYSGKAVNRDVSNQEYNDFARTHDAQGSFHPIVSTGDNQDKLLLFRPHQTYRMASAILAKGGSELGSTFHGHHDFMLSDDIIRKIHVGHYTFYSKSVVKRPKNYVIIEDVMSQGYVGGEGVQAFEDAGEYVAARQRGSLGKGASADIVVVSIPANAEIKNCLDITGRFHPSVYERFNADLANLSEELYPGSAATYGALRLKDVDPYRQSDNDEFINRVQRINTVCFRGCEGKQVDGLFVVTQLNQGHWGDNVYPGVRRVRDGENSFMKDCNYQVGL